MKMLDENSIDCLPDKVKEKYEITDCHVDIGLNNKLVQKWTDLIDVTIQDIELREKDYEEIKSVQCFWDDEESVKAQSYYFANLCSYSAQKHLPYKAYLEKYESNKNNMFGDLLNTTSSAPTTKVIESCTNEPDLSWLDNI